MLQSIVNGVLTSPRKGLKGTCQFCGDIMIAKCGDAKRHHWAHKIRECDEWQIGKETEWHINWKKKIGLDFAEKRITKNDQFHIADILIPDIEGKIDLIVEFQNSPLSQSEIYERERFYGNKLIWVLNGTEIGDKFEIDRYFGFHYNERWWGEPIVDYCLVDEGTGEYEKGYVISTPKHSISKDWETFLFNEGYKRNPNSEKVVELRKYLGLKDKGDSSLNYYYKLTSDLSYNTWLEYRAEFIKKRDLLYITLSIDYQNRMLQNDIIENVRYKWKYAKRDYDIAKRPIYIDLNDEEIFKLENDNVGEGSRGKLIKKKHFIESINKRAKNSQLSLKL